MEPFAAISLTGNILQFVETITKLVSSSKEIARSGNTSEFIELESVVQELKAFSQRLGGLKPRDSDSISQEDQSLQTLADKCLDVTTDLLNLLRKLRLNGEPKKFRSFYAALKAEWKKDEIDNLRNRLDFISRNVIIYMNASNQEKLMHRLDQLQNENHFLQANRQDDIDILTRDVEKLVIRDANRVPTLATKDVRPEPLLDVASKGFEYADELRVLDMLRFDAMDNRFDLIVEAHKHSFSWVYSDDQDSSGHNEPSNFRKWLASSNDFYWISGKPGSGKSTLMKHLCESTNTTEILEEWTRGRKLIMPSYFFWNASPNNLQKTQEGLLRTLIYKILKEFPSIIHKVYPNCRSNFSLSGISIDQQISLYHKGAFHMDAKSLTLHLKHVCSLLIDYDIRICFFIDGLDECHGDLDLLLGFIESLRLLPNAKVCVSSRPWNKFKAAFTRGSSWQLHIQDYSRKDIENYVRDKLVITESFKHGEGKETEGNMLVKELLEASQGVFLWVVLVVKSLNEGIENGDSFRILRRRLGTYPTDLDGFFRVILESHIGTFYRQRASQWFSVLLTSRASLPVGLLWFIDFGEAYDVLEEADEYLEGSEINARLRKIERRIDATCKGLLETRRGVYIRKTDPHGLQAREYVSREVEFLHRTVKDFLLQPSTQSLMRSWDPSDLNPHRAACIAIVCFLKSTDGSDWDVTFSNLLKAFFEHLEQAKASSCSEKFEAALFSSLAGTIMRTTSFDFTEHMLSLLEELISEIIAIDSQACLLDKFGSHLVRIYRDIPHHSKPCRLAKLPPIIYFSMVNLDVEAAWRLIEDQCNLGKLTILRRNELFVPPWELFWIRMYTKYNLAARSNVLPTYDDIDKESADKIISILELGLAHQATGRGLPVRVDTNSWSRQVDRNKSMPLPEILKRLLPSESYAKALEVLDPQKNTTVGSSTSQSRPLLSRLVPKHLLRSSKAVASGQKQTTDNEEAKENSQDSMFRKFRKTRQKVKER